MNRNLFLCISLVWVVSSNTMEKSLHVSQTKDSKAAKTYLSQTIENYRSSRELAGDPLARYLEKLSNPKMAALSVDNEPLLTKLTMEERDTEVAKALGRIKSELGTTSERIEWMKKDMEELLTGGFDESFLWTVMEWGAGGFLFYQFWAHEWSSAIAIALAGGYSKNLLDTLKSIRRFSRTQRNTLYIQNAQKQVASDMRFIETVEGHLQKKKR